MFFGNEENKAGAGRPKSSAGLASADRDFAGIGRPD